MDVDGADVVVAIGGVGHRQLCKSTCTNEHKACVWGCRHT